MSTLRKVVHDDDLNGLKQFLDSNPGPSEDELDNALLYAADKGHAGAVAEQLLHGARITELAFLGAARSQEPIDHGWDINSTRFGDKALRSAACSRLKPSTLLTL
jgi:hypothetical protein